jgi:formylglycine-generating enzyme required for sulfatase activity
VDCTAQAETFISKVKLELGDLPPILDLESDVVVQKDQGILTPSVPNSQIISCAKTWLDKVESETGRTPVIYSGSNFLRERVSESNGQPPSWAKDYTLWIASYLTHDLQAKDVPVQPEGWPNWSFWQYSYKGFVDGVMNEDGSQPQEVDLNIFNGSLNDLRAYLTDMSLVAPQVAIASPTQSLPIGAQAINPIDGATLVHVSGGTFTMGLTEEQMNILRQLCNAKDCEELYQVSQPAHTVELTSGYWIDRTEVSNAQYAKCVDSGSCNPPRSNSSGTRVSYYDNPTFTDYPVVWVDWDRANAYCRWAGGRLPTSAEWEMAASWDEVKQQKYLYPWGNNFDGTLLNFCDKNCLTSQWADLSVDDGNTDTAPVESYAGGASPYGALNMSGNVWEWVSDWFSVSYYKDNTNWIDPKGPTDGTVRVGRGGSFLIRNALTSVAIQDWEEPNNALPDHSYDGVGFRCTVSE